MEVRSDAPMLLGPGAGAEMGPFDPRGSDVFFFLVVHAGLLDRFHARYRARQPSQDHSYPGQDVCTSCLVAQRVFQDCGGNATR
jgi:hypothetical protein